MATRSRASIKSRRPVHQRTAVAGGALLDPSHTTRVDSLTANVDTLNGRAYVCQRID